MGLKKIPKDMSYLSVRHGKKQGIATPTDDRAVPELPTRDRHVEQEEGSVAPDAIVVDADPLSQDDVSNEVPAEPAPHQRRSGKTVRLRGRVYPPDTPWFAEIADIYGDREALKLCVTNGLAAYQVALNGTVPLGRPPRFEKNGKSLEVSRTMSAELYDKATRHVDPMKMMGPSHLGSHILNAALWHYLDSK